MKADEAMLDEAGMPDILKILPIIFSPGNRVYYGIGKSLGHAFAVGIPRSEAHLDPRPRGSASRGPTSPDA